VAQSVARCAGQPVTKTGVAETGSRIWWPVIWQATGWPNASTAVAGPAVHGQLTLAGAELGRG
jgi:hypothetical protein